MRVNEREIDWEDSGDRAYHQGKPYTGEIVEEMADGRIHSLSSYLDGIAHGHTQIWHPNGQLANDWHIDHGKAVGWYRAWYVDGTLAEEDYYDNGKLLTHRKWDEQGTLVKDQTYNPPDR